MMFEISFMRLREAEEAQRREVARLPMYSRPTERGLVEQALTSYAILVARKRADTGRADFSSSVHVSFFLF